MRFDPNKITPCGKTFAEIDAEEAASVRAVNDVLVSMQNLGCRWWRYSVSHCTFELVVGDALARGGNVVISLGACQHISGPVDWSNQQLRVIWENKRETDDGWRYTIEDQTVQFRAVGRVFGWERNYDLLDERSLSRPHQSA